MAQRKRESFWSWVEGWRTLLESSDDVVTLLRDSSGPEDEPSVGILACWLAGGLSTTIRH